MFLRRLSVSRLADWKSPPEYNEDDSLNHLPILLDQCFSENGPEINPLDDDNAKNGKKSVVSLKTLRKTGGNEFLYDPFDKSINPVNKVFDSSSMRLELQVDTETVYLPGLKEDLKSHSSLDSRRSQVEDEELANYKTSLTGNLIITVKTTSIVLREMTLKLNGYSSEYICILEPPDANKDENWSPDCDTANGKRALKKSVKQVMDINDGLSTQLKPFVTDNVGCFKKFPTVLTKGTYILPFTFILDPFNYHSSFSSALGSTSYRVELKMRVLPPSNGSSPLNSTASTKRRDIIFLTHECFITKTLSPSCLLKYESITSQGTYQNGFLGYDFYISSKLIELNCPFQCLFQFQIDPTAVINNVKISLTQMILIPCIKRDLRTPYRKSYVQTNTFALGQYLPTRDSDSNVIVAKFNDVKINANTPGNTPDAKLLPYYCEESRLKLRLDSEVERRFKLKITHVLKVTVSVTMHQNTINFGNTSKNININFKIPIMVIDKNMGSSLYLPAYEPSGMSYRKSTFNLPSECASSDLSSLDHASSLSSCGSPPSYNSLCN